MAYTSKQHLTLAYGETDLIDLTDRSDSGAIDDAVLTLAIETVTGEIDGYLLGRYMLPLETVPPLLRSIANALTFEKLHVAHVDEAASAAARVAREQLKAINAGKLKLESAGADAPGAVVDVRFTGPGPTMTDKALAGF